MDNPCLACSIAQGCCTKLTGLRLSPADYQRNFAHHADALEIRRDGPQYVVTAKAGRCPNWDGQCTVYDTRPMECRLYPVTVTNVLEAGDVVVAVAHDRTGCPQRAALTPAKPDAEALIVGFLKETYGADKTTHVVFDEGPARLAALGVKIAGRVQSAVMKGRTEG